MIAYGEASMPPYLGESHQTVITFLEKAKPVLEREADPQQIESILQTIDVLAIGNTAAKASIDIALHDLAGKMQNKPWHTIWNLDAAKTPFTTYTIGMGESSLIDQKIKDAEPYKILKVKLGSANDKEIIETIRSFTGKPIVVDANQGWTDKYFALDMIEWLNERNVLFVEQPLPKTSRDEMAWVTEHSPLPTIADESVQRLVDIEKAKGVFTGINIKLMKCTGMHEAYEMINVARKNELKVFIGCMSETSCAVSAAAQLTPLADWADLDGPLLIKKDLFSGITFEDGKIKLNDSPGIGVIPSSEIKWE